jgi:L-ascorbate metabolism protein UlaG (beta-lactamase superfamily)
MMNKEQARLTLIDGPTLLIELGGLRILTDPTFDEPQAYTTGATTVEKFHSPPVPAESLLPIDAVLLSHDQHKDNLDISGRAFLPRAGTVLSTVGAGERLGGNTQGLAPWSSVDIPLPDGRILTITGTPGRHGPAGFERINGEVTGFVLAIGDLPAIYVSGDTVWYPGVAEVSRRFNVGLAILYTGGAQPKGPFNVTMNTNDAIEAATAFRNAKIVGIHNFGWSHYRQSQEDLAKAFEAVGLGERLLRLEPAVALTVVIEAVPAYA